MAITTSEARRDLVRLIEGVNLDHTEVEITSKRGSAVLMSKDEYDALVAATVSGRCSERSSLPPVDIREPTLRDEVEGELPKVRW